MIEHRVAVGGAEGVVKIVCPRQGNVLERRCEFKRLLVRELRFIGEYCGYHCAEAVADLAQISLVRYLHKAFDGRLVHRVDVCIAVVARCNVRRFEVCIKYASAFVGIFSVGEPAV